MSAKIYPWPVSRAAIEGRRSVNREQSWERELLRQVDALVFAYSPIVYAELATILGERPHRPTVTKRSPFRLR